MALTGKSHQQPEMNTVSFTRREPVGVCAILAPWNVPLFLACFTMAPALAAGCTIVIKPSEEAPVSLCMLCTIIKEVLPPGVVNMVHGTGILTGEALVKHEGIRAVAFTGRSSTAARVLLLCASQVKQVLLEMGGKNPAIVFQDANLEKAIPECVSSAYTNNGQLCVSISIFFVHSSIFQTFVDRFRKATNKSAQATGPPENRNTIQGPLISKYHLQRVLGYIEVAKADGATVYETELPPLSKDNSNGYFMSPTVVTDIPATSRLLHDEIFGPVACIVPFDAEEEAIKLANATRYGICASIWSVSSSRLQRVASKLKVGTVWCNCWRIADLTMPFGGMRHSGLGRLAGNSFDFFTEQKTVVMTTDD